MLPNGGRATVELENGDISPCAIKQKLQASVVLVSRHNTYLLRKSTHSTLFIIQHYRIFLFFQVSTVFRGRWHRSFSRRSRSVPASVRGVRARIFRPDETGISIEGEFLSIF